MLKRRASDPFEEHLQAEAAREFASQVDGKHYSAHVAEVKALRRAGDDDAAGGLLARLCDAVEREASIPLAGHVAVPPWYFEQLAIIYKKAGLKAERERVLRRLDRLQVMAEASGRVATERLRRATGAPARRQVKPADRPAPQPSVLVVLARALGRLLGRIGRRRR